MTIHVDILTTIINITKNVTSYLPFLHHLPCTMINIIMLFQ